MFRCTIDVRHSENFEHAQSSTTKCLLSVPLYDLIHTHDYVLVIRRKDNGLTDIVSNEGRRPEFDTISVRP